MKYETGINLYTFGMVVGISSFYLFRWLSNTIPTEFAFILTLSVLQFCRWAMEKAVAPKRETKKEEKPKEKPTNERK